MVNKQEPAGHWLQLLPLLLLLLQLRHVFVAFGPALASLVWHLLAKG